MKVLGASELSTNLKSLADQAPFITATALTTTAFQIQQETRQVIPQWVHLTRPQFIPRQILVERANYKSITPTATVGFSDKVPLAMLMEIGGTRRPTGKAVVVPEAVKKNSRGGITQANKPSALLQKKGYFSKKIGAIAGIWRYTKRLGLSLQYIYKPNTKHTKQFSFHQVANKVAQSNLSNNFEAAMLHAIRSRKR